MCSYEDLSSYKKTQLPTIFKNGITSLSKKTSFIDHALRLNKHCVAPNRYENLERAYTKISPGPSRPKRH